MLVEHRAVGQRRPRPVHPAPAERAHPLSVPRRSLSRLQQHRRKVVPIVGGQIALRVDQRVGAIGHEQHLAAGEQRFAHWRREARRHHDIRGVRRRIAWPVDGGQRAKGRLVHWEQRRRSAGTTQNSRVLRDRRSPAGSRASSSSGTVVITSTAPPLSAIVVGSVPSSASPLCSANRQATLAPSRLRQAGKPEGNVETLADANCVARRPRNGGAPDAERRLHAHAVSQTIKKADTDD